MLLPLLDQVTNNIYTSFKGLNNKIWSASAWHQTVIELKLCHISLWFWCSEVECNTYRKAIQAAQVVRQFLTHDFRGQNFLVLHFSSAESIAPNDSSASWLELLSRPVWNSFYPYIVNAEYVLLQVQFHQIINIF
jgi:hypothetical protein